MNTKEIPLTDSPPKSIDSLFSNQSSEKTNTQSKWSVKYSRYERNRKKLHQPLNGLTHIPNYFHVINKELDKEDQLLKQNSDLKKIIETYVELTDMTPSNSDLHVDSSEFLKSLSTASKNNASKNVHGHRYDESLRKFASYLFLMGGRSTYEVLEQNFKGAHPSTSTISKNRSKFDKPV